MLQAMQKEIPVAVTSFISALDVNDELGLLEPAK